MKKIALLFLTIWLSGCAAAPVIRPHRIRNVALDPVAARTIRRIAVFPLYDPQDLEGVAERLSDIISLQVLKIGRFKVIEPTRVTMMLAQKNIRPGAAAEMTDMLEIGAAIGADAIVTGQVIAYRSYHYYPERLVNREEPAIIGLNLKMVTLKEHNVIWTASDIFNGFDEAVAALAPADERWKVRLDIDFLSTLLIQQLTQTLNY